MITKQIVKYKKFYLDEPFDELIYREAQNTRSYSDWTTMVISATVK